MQWARVHLRLAGTGDEPKPSRVHRQCPDANRTMTLHPMSKREFSIPSDRDSTAHGEPYLCRAGTLGPTGPEGRPAYQSIEVSVETSKGWDHGSGGLGATDGFGEDFAQPLESSRSRRPLAPESVYLRSARHADASGSVSRSGSTAPKASTQVLEGRSSSSLCLTNVGEPGSTEPNDCLPFGRTGAPLSMHLNLRSPMTPLRQLSGVIS